MATSIDMFAYLAAFVSIILALAVSDLVQSLHRLLRARRKVKWSLTALIAAAYLLQALWVFGVFVRLMDLFESVIGRTTSTLEMAAMFPWQTIPLLCIFALLCWSSSIRVQLVGVIAVFALVNGTIADRSIAVRPVAPLQQ